MIPTEKHDGDGDEEAAGAEAKVIENFEAMGSAVFNVETDAAAFEALNEYIRRNAIPTLTDVDKENGIVTITKRPVGSLEVF